MSTILDTLRLILIPDRDWLSRLRRGHFIWLQKEQEFAKVSSAWEPPEPGTIAGVIHIERLWRTENEWGFKGIQRWYVKSDGRGLDNSQLILPVRNNCPEEPTPISEPWQIHIERSIGKLVSELDQLKEEVRNLKYDRMDYY